MKSICDLSICFLAIVLPAGNKILGSSVSSSHIAIASWYLNEHVEPNACASYRLKLRTSWFMENYLN
jgi:hypothetical protein